MRIRTSPILLLPLIAILTGCGSDSDRVASLALRDAERQAQQNQKLIESHGQVTQGARDLVAADGASRLSLSNAHRDLQAERSEIGKQRDQLEEDRRTVAFQRRTDPILNDGFAILAALLAAIAPLTLCWLLLRRANEPADMSMTAELLLDDLVRAEPIVGPMRPTSTPSLTTDQASPAALDNPDTERS